MTNRELIEKIQKIALGVLVVILLGFILFYPAPTRAEETKTLEWEVNENVSVFISNIPCPLSFKNKYPYAAVAVDKKARIAMKGCYAKKDENLIVIHWEGFPDTNEANATVPANVFLVNPNKPQQQVPKNIPEDKGIDI